MTTAPYSHSHTKEAIIRAMLSLNQMKWINDQLLADNSSNKGEISGPPDLKESTAGKELGSSECKLREYICGEEALRISPTEPYCLRRPIRRGHLNVSLYYPMQQVTHFAIWITSVNMEEISKNANSSKVLS